MRMKWLVYVLLFVTAVLLFGWFSGGRESFRYANAYGRLDEIRTEADVLKHFGPPTRITHGTSSTIPELLGSDIANPSAMSGTPLTWYWYVPRYRIFGGPWVVGIDEDHDVASWSTWKKVQ